MDRPRRIALLGGGQLGRMFIENALRYDAEVHVLDPDPACPCAWLAHRYVQGRFDDRDTVLRFAADADVVGIEIEHVSVEALEVLEGQGKRVIPSAATLRTIQDKGFQKDFYARHGIPTAPYALINSVDGIAEHQTLLPGFLKARTGGYDGKGVLPIARATDVPAEFTGPYVLEQRAEVVMELGVIAVRASDGSTVVYDPVEMVFDPALNLVDMLRAPAQCAPEAGQRAKELALRVAEAFGEPGIYAVEMFLLPTGEVWVNETAPRAHNSGHFTIEACASSQFDQLLRLYMEWPAGDTRLRGEAAMVNLVGAEGTGVPRLDGAAEILALPGTYVHLYGKAQTRPGRKMGHITIIADDREQLEAVVAVCKAHGKVVPWGTEKPQPTLNQDMQ